MNTPEFYTKLNNIAQKHHNLTVAKKYTYWQEYYEEDLQELYNIVSKYYYIDYNIFQKMVYETSNW